MTAFRLAIVGPAAVVAVGAPLIILWPTTPPRAIRPSRITTAIPQLTVEPLDARAVTSVLGGTKSGAATAPDGSTGAPEAAPAAPPVVTGLITVSAGRGIALVRNTAGETVQLTRGETVDGWRLVAIGRASATFERPGERVEVGLNLGNRVPNTSQETPPTPPAEPMMER